MLQPAPVVVSVRGVGDLRVDHGTHAAVFNRDRYLVPTSDEQITSLISSSVPETLAVALEPRSVRLYEELCELPGFEAAYRRRSDPRAPLHRHCARIVRSLAKSIRALGRGGSVLIVPDPARDLPEVADRYHALEATYVSGPGQEWTGSLLEVLASEGIVARDGVAGTRLDDPFLRRLLEAHRQAEEEIQQTAHLARADGAIVLDWLFSPLALGTKLKTRNSEALAPDVAGFLRDREKGMRHRSMAFAVGSVRGSLGLVVSVDGECTLFGHLKTPEAHELVV
jgi:hypothetical protein